ncbi:glycosyltransferase family 35 protein [Chiua virens]|nr:glycosyltransferase family 35 protein [Chiua virens]
MTSVLDPSTIGKPKRPRRHVRSLTGYLPEKDESGKERWPRGEETVWKDGYRPLDTSVQSITKSFVNHVQTSLARQVYSLDDLGAYQATALINWNDTQLHMNRKGGKRAYYLSLEFLMGRALDNALLNLGLKDKFEQGTDKLGFNLEDLLAQERDAASQELPVWGYGLRYKYGIFQQLISPDGQQLEAPDPWLENSNPWELPRIDVTYEIRFYGVADRYHDGSGRGVWHGGQEVLAVAYDVMIPGFNTRNTNNLRLWESKPKRGFDLNSFNAGDYERAVESSNSAAAITAVLYPNDHTSFGKELRLKQQYFWTAASLADILRRFKNLGKPITELSDYVAIQLNDTHPTLAIPELMRILLDEEDLPWGIAWKIVTETFFFTNHTVLPEALEKWPVPLLEHLLPRHMQIIYDIVSLAVEQMFPGDRDRFARMSLIEEGFPKNIRMAHLACIGSRKVNGVAELHSELVRTTILKDFVDYYGVGKYVVVCNPRLSELITETLKIPKSAWLKDLSKLQRLLNYVEDEDFQAAWASGLKVDTHALFDVQIKLFMWVHTRVHRARWVLHFFPALLEAEAMQPEERKKAVPRNVFFAGKAAPGCHISQTIRLIVNVARVLNADPDTQDYLRVFFLPDYSVTLAEVLIPASDISQHISTAGTEASGTSNMKFCLNGGLLLGTVDGANIEIAEEVGSSNVFFFGNLTPDVEDLRYQHTYHPIPVEQKSPALAQVLDVITKGLFGDDNVYEPLLNTIRKGDHYLITDDFDSYIEALQMVDEAYEDRTEWTKKSIRTTAKMGKFSSDRAIQDYAQEYWNIESSKVE